MKLRVGIKYNIESTPESKIEIGEIFNNQKRKHAKVKSCSLSDMTEKSPIRKPLFNHRKRSLNKRPVNSLNSCITPLSSRKKDRFKVLIRPSSCSSGYESLSKSSSSFKKSYVTFKVPIRKSLNIGVFLENNTGKVNKVGKTRMYNNIKLTNYLPPRALATSASASPSFELWHCMAKKQEIYKRDPNYLSRQCFINSSMRSILIDWMVDVCDAYNLDLETFYLSVDYLDRYLSTVNHVPTQSLQAIGTTSLYIASKLHEITPPHVENFAHVTDGACIMNDIITQEAHMLSKLNWHLHPITPLSWLTLFLQISCIQEDENGKLSECKEYKGPLTRLRYMKSFENTYLSKNFLVRGEMHKNLPYYTKILNKCIMDSGCLCHSYGIIAASLLYLTTEIDVFNITGFGSEEISACTKWLKQFIQTTDSTVEPNQYSNILQDCTNGKYRPEQSKLIKSDQVEQVIGNEKENTLPYYLRVG